MVQVLEVVRCYSCQTFQVQIQKKVKKWVCKVCNEKQSLKKVYFSGMGAECRKVAMDLNMKRGEIIADKETELLETEDSGEEAGDYDLHQEPEISSRQPKKSKWSVYIDEDDEDITKQKPDEPPDVENEDVYESDNHTESYEYQTNIQFDAPNENDGQNGIENYDRHENYFCLGDNFEESAFENLYQRTGFRNPNFSTAGGSLACTKSNANGPKSDFNSSNREFGYQDVKPVARVAVNETDSYPVKLSHGQAGADIGRQFAAKSQHSAAKTATRNRLSAKKSKWASYVTEDDEENQNDSTSEENGHSSIHAESSDHVNSRLQEDLFLEGRSYEQNSEPAFSASSQSTVATDNTSQSWKIPNPTNRLDSISKIQSTEITKASSQSWKNCKSANRLSTTTNSQTATDVDKSFTSWKRLQPASRLATISSSQSHEKVCKPTVKYPTAVKPAIASRNDHAAPKGPRSIGQMRFRSPLNNLPSVDNKAVKISRNVPVTDFSKKFSLNRS